MVGGVTDQISAQFNGLTSGNAQQKIREDENVQKLLQTIQNFSMDFMMLPDLPAVAQEDPYKNMNLNQSLAKFFASSGACDDFEWDGQSTFGRPPIFREASSFPHFFIHVGFGFVGLP